MRIAVFIISVVCICLAMVMTVFMWDTMDKKQFYWIAYGLVSASVITVAVFYSNCAIKQQKLKNIRHEHQIDLIKQTNFVVKSVLDIAFAHKNANIHGKISECRQLCAVLPTLRHHMQRYFSANISDSYNIFCEEFCSAIDAQLTELEQAPESVEPEQCVGQSIGQYNANRVKTHLRQQYEQLYNEMRLYSLR